MRSIIASNFVTFNSLSSDKLKKNNSIITNAFYKNKNWQIYTRKQINNWKKINEKPIIPYIPAGRSNRQLVKDMA